MYLYCYAPSPLLQYIGTPSNTKSILSHIRYGPLPYSPTDKHDDGAISRHAARAAEVSGVRRVTSDGLADISGLFIFPVRTMP